MSRRASNAAGGGVSLFPFLSILACLIGILTLMIKLISDMKTMEHTGKQDEKQVELAREFQAVKNQIKKAEKESVEITESMRRRSAVFKEMDDLEERRVVLKRELADKGAATAKEKDVSLQKIVERLVQQIEALRRERPELEKKLAELKAELEKRKKKPDDKPLPVRVHPGGSGSAAKYELSFLECNSTGVVILGKDGKQTPVSTAAIETDRSWTRYSSPRSPASGP